MGSFLAIFGFADVQRKQNDASNYCKGKYGPNSVYKSATTIGGPVSCQDKNTGQIQESIPRDEVAKRIGTFTVFSGGSRSRQNKGNTHKRKKKASNNKNRTKK